MTLVEICEPIFQYICRLNRLARKGGRADFTVVRTDINGIFESMRRTADAAPGMSLPYTEVEPVLVFFVDSMILNSGLSGWRPMSEDRKELAFEEKFWDMLEDTLKDTSEGATQRLGVFYVCIGLGFTGIYASHPDLIRRKMAEISSRLRGLIDADQAAKICADAYQHVDGRNLTLPPNRSLTGMFIALGALTVVLLLAYIFMFRSAAQGLGASLKEIQDSHAASGKAAG